MWPLLHTLQLHVQDRWFLLLCQAIKTPQAAHLRASSS
jgi:hypothetical protein